MEEGQKKWVCVTGATGFIAGHVVEELLKGGHNIRATVRDPKDKKKNGHLLAMAEKYKKLNGAILELHSADLLKEGSFDSVVEGCWAVVHTASPVAAGTPKDAQKELVEPAEKGTLNVLQSCHKARVKRVVITSSVATINAGSNPGEPVPTYTEKDHNHRCSLSWHAYSFSKVKAEEATNKFLASLPEEERFGLATIHPSLVLGPQQNTMVTSSNITVKMLLSGEYPFAPPIHWRYVDVRDVARAHRFVLENENTSGRYIVSNPQGLWMREQAAVLKKLFPKYPVPRFQMPLFLLKAAALIDGRITPEVLLDQTREGPVFDGSKIEKEGFVYAYKDKLEQTLKDAGQSMIDLKIIPPPKPSNKWLIFILFFFMALVVYWKWFQ